MGSTAIIGSRRRFVHHDSSGASKLLIQIKSANRTPLMMRSSADWLAERVLIQRSQVFGLNKEQLSWPLTLLPFCQPLCLLVQHSFRMMRLPAVVVVGAVGAAGIMEVGLTTAAAFTLGATSVL